MLLYLGELWTASTICLVNYPRLLSASFHTEQARVALTQAPSRGRYGACSDRAAGPIMYDTAGRVPAAAIAWKAYNPPSSSARGGEEVATTELWFAVGCDKVLLSSISLSWLITGSDTWYSHPLTMSGFE